MRRFGRHVVGLLAASSVLGTSLLAVAATRAEAAPVHPSFVVTTVSDDIDASLNDGVCRTAAGDCSLRAAIMQANRNAGPNQIGFALPGAGAQTVQLTKALPTISDTTGGLTIDGYTQPGSAPNSDALVSNAQLMVQIRGIGSSGSTACFSVTSAGNTFRGLAIFNCYYGIKFTGNAADGNHVLGNFIGTNAAGTYGDPTGFTLAAGLWFYTGASGNVVGTPALADRNVISGNRTVGVKMEQTGTTGNVVQNNIIGLNPAGTARLPNNAGLDLQWYSHGNIVGGMRRGERNVISGNAYTGIDLSHTTRLNQIVGNLIGTTPTGTSAASWSANPDGILLKDDPTDNTISGNVIAGNSANGIWAKHNFNSRNFIIGNRIGVGLDGSAIANGSWGIWLTGEDHIIEANVIANNRAGGINVNNTNGGNTNHAPELTERNRISDNFFYANNGLDIDITPAGTNPNDVGDADGGVQGMLNYPEVSSVAVGELAGTTCPGCTVELSLVDPAINARRHVATSVADGAGAFAITDPVISHERSFAALAIDPSGNTSEFSPPVGVSGSGAPVAPSTLEGSFVYQTISGRQVALVPEGGAFNESGASGTTSRVRFDVTAPTSSNYSILAEVTAPSGSSDSFWVQVDGQPTAGFRWNVSPGSEVHLDEVAAFGGPDPFVVALAAGPHTITLSMREDGTGVASVALTEEPAIGGLGLDLTAPSDRSSPLGAEIDDQILASDPDAGVVTYTAIGLPGGLLLDPLTGAVTGTASSPGVHAVNVIVTDGVEFRSADFTWTVVPPNSAPTLPAPDDQIDRVGTPTSLAVTASDPDGDPLTFDATDLPPGLTIDPASGVVSGQPTALGTWTVTVTVADPFGHEVSSQFVWRTTPAPFTCFVDGATRTLSWTDQGVSQYNIRHIVDGTDTYLRSVSGLSTPVTLLYGTYKVVYSSAGVTHSTTCDGPAAPPVAFTCSIDAATSTLSWTDQGATTYYIRRVDPSGEVYVGSSTGLSIHIAQPTRTHIVQYTVNGVKHSTSCSP